MYDRSSSANPPPTLHLIHSCLFAVTFSHTLKRSGKISLPFPPGRNHGSPSPWFLSFLVSTHFQLPPLPTSASISPFPIHRHVRGEGTPENTPGNSSVHLLSLSRCLFLPLRPKKRLSSPYMFVSLRSLWLPLVVVSILLLPAAAATPSESEFQGSLFCDGMRADIRRLAVSFAAVLGCLLAVFAFWYFRISMIPESYVVIDFFFFLFFRSHSRTRKAKTPSFSLFLVFDFL